VKLACVNMKDAGKIMGVSVEVVIAYVKQGNLQWIPVGPDDVGSDKMIPLYEIASLRDITLKAVMNRTREHSVVISYIWIKAEATSSV